MELIRCEALRAKISLAECRIRKEKAAKADHHDFTVPGLTYSFQQCLDCEPEGKKRVEVEDTMGTKMEQIRIRKRNKMGPTPPPKYVPLPTEKTKAPSLPLENKVIVDFTAYPELYDQLHQIAATEMRTPEKQILYFLKHGDLNGCTKQV